MEAVQTLGWWKTRGSCESIHVVLPCWSVSPLLLAFPLKITTLCVVLLLTEGYECAFFRTWLSSKGNESTQNPKYTIMLKCSADAQTWAFLFSHASQMGHFFPGTGSWEPKCTQEVARVAGPCGVAGPCWMPRVGTDQVGLTHHPALLPQLWPKASFQGVFPWDTRCAAGPLQIKSGPAPLWVWTVWVSLTLMKLHRFPPTQDGSDRFLSIISQMPLFPIGW